MAERPIERFMISKPEAAKLLLRTPERAWRYLSLLIDESGARIMSRGELKAWLRNNDLGDLAHEAGARNVPRGSILALVLSDESGPAFKVLSRTSKVTP